MAWLLAFAGVFFCLAGVWHLNRSAFEEGKTLLAPALVILGGVVLIAMGTARYFGLLS